MEADNTVAVCYATINYVAASTEIVIDSANGLITAEGFNRFVDTDQIDFPYLLLGDNTISCSVVGLALFEIYIPFYA